MHSLLQSKKQNAYAEGLKGIGILIVINTERTQYKVSKLPILINLENLPKQMLHL